MSDTADKLSEKLGIDSNRLADSCAKFSKMLIEANLFGGKNHDDIIAFVRENFSEEERIMLSIGYLTDKTDDLLGKMGGMKGLAQELIESYKKSRNQQ